MTDIPTGFTPGPWEVLDKPLHGHNFTVVSPSGDAELGNWVVAGTRWETDARLIAAAPAMAEEIKRLRAENERLTRRVEWFTHAVHTCHDECDRPLCKTTREREALRALNAELVEGLKTLALAYVNLMEVGRDRIKALGGDCDPVDVMEAGDPSLRAARALIARAEGR